MLKECCGYFSHPLDVYEASPEKVLGPAEYCCGNSNEKL